MGMISAFNALLECVVSGTVTALILYTLGRLGHLPFLVMLNEEEAAKLQEVEDDE